MLDNLLEFTSNDEFIANNIFKVVGHNFSDDGSINLLIEGDIKSYDYSVALISMLPAFKNNTRIGTLYLKYTNLNKENLSEALLTEAIATLYPTKVVDYLLTRAECLFEIDGLHVAASMNMNIIKLISFIEDYNNEQIVRSFFSKDSTKTERVFVNDIEFELIPPFYLGSGEPSLYLDKIDNCSWGQLDCVSRRLNDILQFTFNQYYLKDSDFNVREYIYNQKDIYISLVSCFSTNNHDFVERIKYGLNPGSKLQYMLADCGYSGLVKFYNIQTYYQSCENDPCRFYEREIKRRNNRFRILDKIKKLNSNHQDIK